MGSPRRRDGQSKPSQATLPHYHIQRQEDTYWVTGVGAEGLASESCRPLEAKLVEQRLAAGTGLLAEGPAGPPGLSLHTLRGVDGAQEGLELVRAARVEQWRKSVQLLTGIVLALVAQGVWQQCLGVGLILTDRDCDGLTGWGRCCGGAHHTSARSLDKKAKGSFTFCPSFHYPFFLFQHFLSIKRSSPSFHSCLPSYSILFFPSAFISTSSCSYPLTL